ncbi:MAG: hypothetical protein ACW967_09370 [Candidatus Hodarchaeales archaeon]|jgi:hypothetical protein
MQDNTFLFIVFGLVSFVIVFLLYYYRDYLPIGKTQRRKTDVDAEIEELLDRIRQLARSHEYQKASLNVWKAFNVASEGFLGMGREPNQTARQFGISLMQFDGITQETVEPLYNLFEAARYGRDSVSLQQFNAGLTGLHRFLQIAKQISSIMEKGTQGEEGELGEVDEFAEATT